MFICGTSPAFSDIKHTADYTNYVKTIRGIDFYSNQSKDLFANALANEYKSLALYKSQFSNDMGDANNFAVKALTAYYGERVRPDNIYKRRLPSLNIVEISNYYDDLLKILDSEVQNTYPQLVAEAQVKFDCWVESEEDGFVKQAVNCQNRFLKAREKLLAIMDEDCFKCKKKPERPVVKVKKLKQFDGKHLTLPKWPNMPMLRNNPPKPVIVAQNDISKDLQNIFAYIKNIEAELKNIKSAQKSAQVVQNSPNGKTVIVSDPNNASKADMEALKKYLETLEKELAILKAKNSNAEFASLEEQILSVEKQVVSLSEQINAIEIPECPTCSLPIVEEDEEEEEYMEIAEDEYLEEEIFDAPSDLLPFEIFFDWNKADVDYKFLPQLKDISERALSSKETIIIQGHTDSSGSPEYNKKLSDRRAKAVAKIIESYGIPHEKITLQAMGSDEQKVPTANGVKKAENRRVVIK